jgi:hypothetical protein
VTFFQKLIERIPQHVTTTFFLDICSAGDMMQNACKRNHFGGKTIVFGACLSSQEIEDDWFMQRILTPIVRGQTKKMTNNEVFMKMKDNYKKNKSMVSSMLSKGDE